MEMSRKLSLLITIQLLMYVVKKNCTGVILRRSLAFMKPPLYSTELKTIENIRSNLKCLQLCGLNEECKYINTIQTANNPMQCILLKDGLPEQVATGKPCQQSGQYGLLACGLALDGDTKTDVWYMMALTDFVWNPWWRVDLLAVYKLVHVTLYKRAQQEFYKNFGNYDIVAQISLNGVENLQRFCQEMVPKNDQLIETLTCKDHTIGRHVTIRKMGVQSDVAVHEVLIYAISL